MKRHAVYCIISLFLCGIGSVNASWVLGVVPPDDVMVEEGESALHREARLLIGTGGALDALFPREEDGAVVDYSLLQWAAKTGDEAVVRYMTVCGAEIDMPDARRWTSLHLAIMAGQSHVVRCLIHYGANTEVVDFQGRTPLHWAVLAGQLESAEALLDAGAVIDAVTIVGNTSLHLAVMQENVALVKLLLDAGANVRCQNAEGVAALHLAVRQKGGVAWSLMSLLLDYQADPNCQNNKGLTPLHNIINEADTVLFCIEEMYAPGFAKNALQQKMVQAYQDQVAEVLPKADVLLRAGADPNIRSESGDTPLDYAYLMQDEHGAGGSGEVIMAIISLLENNGAVSGSLIAGQATTSHPDQTEEQMVAVVERIIRMGGLIDAPARKRDGLSYLHLAAEYGYLDVARALVEAGADVNVRKICGDVITKKATGSAPLHLAAKGGHTEMVRYLLDHDASINLKGNHGLTPLHAAAEGGHISVIQLLLDRCARIDEQDVSGQTALFIAVIENHYDAVELLLKYGADPAMSLVSGQTVYDVACNQIIRKLLRRYMQKGGRR